MNKPMTKTQLVAALAEAMGSDKKTANAALDAIAEVVSKWTGVPVSRSRVGWKAAGRKPLE